MIAIKQFNDYNETIMTERRALSNTKIKIKQSRKNNRNCWQLCRIEFETLYLVKNTFELDTYFDWYFNPPNYNIR